MLSLSLSLFALANKYINHFVKILSEDIKARDLKIHSTSLKQTKMSSFDGAASNKRDIWEQHKISLSVKEGRWGRGAGTKGDK